VKGSLGSPKFPNSENYRCSLLLSLEGSISGAERSDRAANALIFSIFTVRMGSSVSFFCVKVMHFNTRRQTSQWKSVILSKRGNVASFRSPKTIAYHQARSFSRRPRKMPSADAIQEESCSDAFPWDSASRTLECLWTNYN
jgi:hypothetical protein